MWNRLTVVPALALALTACGSLWVPDPPEGWVSECVQQPFFFDLDGDGWGSPDQEPQSHCEAREQWSARNALDCDDNDGAVGAKLGTLCPSGLAPGLDPAKEGAARGYLGVIADDAEFVVVLDPGEVNYALHAEAACAAWGGLPPAADAPDYTGYLATFASESQFAQIRDAVGSLEYAGYIGVEVVVDATGKPVKDACDTDETGCACVDDGSLCWAWSDETDTEFTSVGVGWCDGTPPGDDNLDRVALIHPTGGEWCIGSPEELDYHWSEAHFVCERARPDPAGFAWWPLEDEAPAE